MKRIAVIILSVMFLFVGTTLWAQEDGHGREADVIIDEIKQNQGVGTISLIDPDEISPVLLEELGDAVMGLMIVDEQQHEWMDQMMGGEGSDQLASTHRWIAYNYLRNDGNLSTWGLPMGGHRFMGPGMMGGWNGSWGDSPYPSYNRWNYGPGSMMGWSGPWWSWGFGILIIVIGAVIVVILIRSNRRSSKHSSEALNILRNRYAKGEITREEYHQMSKELSD